MHWGCGNFTIPDNKAKKRPYIILTTIENSILTQCGIRTNKLEKHRPTDLKSNRNGSKDCGEGINRLLSVGVHLYIL